MLPPCGGCYTVVNEPGAVESAGASKQRSVSETRNIRFVGVAVAATATSTCNHSGSNTNSGTSSSSKYTATAAAGVAVCLAQSPVSSDVQYVAATYHARAAADAGCR